MHRPHHAIKPGLSIGHASSNTNPDSIYFGMKINRCGRRATIKRRHILSVARDNHIHTYHATKGWRSEKV